MQWPSVIDASRELAAYIASKRPRTCIVCDGRIGCEFCPRVPDQR